MRRRLQRPPRAGDARLRVDDDADGLDRVHERREREQDGGGVAARVRDQRPFGREELRDRVAPGAERAGGRMLEPVPLRIERGVVEPVRAREVDDDGVGRRLERCRPLVLEAAEDELGAGRERLVVGDERRQRAVQARVEHARGLSRRASRSRARRAPAPGARARGRASPGRNSRRRRGWSSQHSCCVLCMNNDYYAVNGRQARARGRHRLHRTLRRRGRGRRRRGVLHDRLGGLRAGRHRPELRAPGAHVRLSARRQLRRRRGAARVGPRLDRGRRDAARAARRGPTGSRSAGSSRWRRSTRARSSAASARTVRCAARSVRRRRRSCTPARSPSRTSTGRACSRSPSSPRRHPRSTPASPSRSRSAPGRASSCSTSAASARSCGGSSRRASRWSSFPATGTPTRCSSSSPPRCWSATAPATRRSSTARSRPCASCSGSVPLFGICLGHQLVGLALGLETFKLPFGHRGANHPVRVTGSKPRARHRAEPRLRGRARRRGRGEPRLAQRRHRRGPRAATASRRCSSTPRPRPARTTPFPSSTGSRTHAEAHRPTQHPDRRLRADPHRPGLRVRLLGRRRPAARCAREGYRVVLVNSNPATIMTDPEWADATYLEPLDAADARRDHRRASSPTRCSPRSAARRRSTSPSSWPRTASWPSTGSS